MKSVSRLPGMPSLQRLRVSKIIILQTDRKVECHFNVKKLFKFLNFYQFDEQIPVTFDMKLQNIFFGCGSPTSSHGCGYCTVQLLRWIII